MNNRERIISKEPTGRKENEFILVTVSYDNGGINYYTYQNNPRGYWLHVTVRTEKSENGFTTIAFSLFQNGLKHLLEPSARFNAKRMAQIAIDPAVLAGMKTKVLEMTAPKTEVK